MSILLGLDVGTSGVRVVAIDTEGRLVTEAYHHRDPRDRILVAKCLAKEIS